jgi:hypothetical protein
VRRAAMCCVSWSDPTGSLRSNDCVNSTESPCQLELPVPDIGPRGPVHDDVNKGMHTRGSNGAALTNSSVSLGPSVGKGVGMGRQLGLCLGIWIMVGRAGRRGWDKSSR